MKPALCKRCGTEFDPADERCPSCLHRRVSEVPLPPTPRAWWLLAFLPVLVIALSVRALSRPPASPARPPHAPEPVVRVGALKPEPDAVTRDWITDASGTQRLQLSTEVEPYERAVRLLKTALLDELPEVATREGAHAEVTLRLPARFDDGGLARETDAEAAQLNALLARSKRVTRAGEPVRVVFRYAH